ncbi:M12 family metallo-peptidase [Dyadobacter sp. CY347]|uniref:M12 family metallo-peptidase n=1 Tax=Dyadobacter sp. CY347 TaxID=2909336 RepID=UPI001F1C0E6F|nr:M12 family metallo-peptidase [Dyadobacter sp. CY347]MCF2488968.1 M12 family metallo-peptidase [Dyadobacter sp. CY347]
MKLNFTNSIWFGLFLLLCTLSTIAQQAPPICGTNDSLSASRLDKYSRIRDITRARTSSGQKLEYRLALDINYKTYQLYGGDKALITKKAVRFINDASAIFERDINVKLTITSILIWDHPEPYALDEDFQYYSNVQNYWVFNRTDERDAVVSLSVRDGWFYGGYRMCSSNFPKPDMPDLPVDLLCHELGHTLGSPHTHSCSWPGGPIDRCTALEGVNEECEEGYQESVNGSLMSYCRSILKFHPLCQNLMREYAEGRLDESFKLTPIAENPDVPDSLIIYEDNEQKVSHTPSFRWKTPFGVDKYQFQIARDADFRDIVEDTLVAQSHFTSAGLGEGDYYARVLSVQIPKAALWSQPLPFNISKFDENTPSPLFMQVSWKNDDLITGLFRKYDGTESYQIELADRNQTDGVTYHDFPVTSQKIQRVKIPLTGKQYQRYSIRLRVKKDNIWSKWSDPEIFNSPWNSEVWAPTRLSETSASPMLAAFTYVSTLHTGFWQNMEVATDPEFQNVVFKDSIALSEMNQTHVNKGVFHPVLEENRTYYGRSRTQYLPGIFTSWKPFEIKTNWKDERLTYHGVVSRNLSTTNSFYNSNFIPQFYTTNDQLYVYGGNQGYFKTRDLKDWQSIATASTKGKSPNQVNYFGVSGTGDVFAMSFNNIMLKRTPGGIFEQHMVTEKFFTDQLAPLIVTASDGIFFKTFDRGVGRFFNGKWTLYGADIVGHNHVMTVAADADQQIWAVMEDGFVFSFKDEKWTQQPQLTNSQELSGIAFDKEQNIYAYGGWGISKLNKANRNWEVIVSPAGHFIRKVVFDKENRLWAAAYGVAEHYDPFALIKYENQKLTLYSDGLNFLKEPFDLTIFNDKLLIMTSGGEVHSFQENQFQRFQPKASYEAGDEIALTLTTNSTFGKHNETSFILRNTGSNEAVTIKGTSGAEKTYTFKIPADIKGGIYQLKTKTTEPEVTSNESVAFKIIQSATVNKPDEVTLMQNVPNPFGSSTDISFFLPAEDEVTLTLFNARGQKMMSLAEGKYPAGWHLARLEGQKLASGVYIYQLKAGPVTKTLKMVR